MMKLKGTCAKTDACKRKLQTKWETSIDPEISLHLREIHSRLTGPLLQRTTGLTESGSVLLLMAAMLKQQWHDSHALGEITGAEQHTTYFNTTVLLINLYPIIHDRIGFTEKGGETRLLAHNQNSSNNGPIITNIHA